MNEINEIVSLVERSPGYLVEICGIYVGKMSDGKYHVFSEQSEKWEIEFDNAKDAVEFFCEKRKSLRLGFDFAHEFPESNSENYMG